MSTLPAGIQHVVVLMLENRSFDHMLGRLPGVAGPAGRTNTDPEGGAVVPVTFDATPTSPALPDPAQPGQVAGDAPHDFIAVNRQLFETDRPASGAPATLGGFIAAARASGDPATERIAREVMRCFDAAVGLPTTGALAAAFVVCDQWFASVPGPTWPNRLFMHAATSFGALDDALRLYPGPTIYDRLDGAGVDWAIYYHDFPQSLCFHGLAERRDRLGRQCLRPVADFFKDARSHHPGPRGPQTLPPYVFIEPGYFEPTPGIAGWLLDLLEWLARLVGIPLAPSAVHANDQHPPHDVRFGEHLIADVFDALRANEDVWQHCLFIVLHDEHGGLYDHVAPPAAVPPDARGSVDPPFAFDRLGLRVPAVLISPYVRAGIDSTPYEHASIVRTVREHFCPGAAPLTARDAAALALRADLFTDAPRSDAPRRIARATPSFAIKRTGDPTERPLNDLQASLVHLAAAMGTPPAAPAVAGAPPDLTGTPRPAIGTVAEGHAFVRRQMQRRGLR